MDIGEFDALAWYRNIPPVSRTYLTATVVVTVLATLELLSPFDLYYNSNLIMQGQVRPGYSWATMARGGSARRVSRGSRWWATFLRDCALCHVRSQLWRLVTSFLFFGQLGLGFFLNMFFT